jgi:hypothetical protein
VLGTTAELARLAPVEARGFALRRVRLGHGALPVTSDATSA